MKHTAYRTLMTHIPVPADLNERVLQAARRAELKTAPRQVPARVKPRRHLVPRVVCAVCTLALVLGVLYLRPAQPGETGLTLPGQSGPVVPAYSFGLAAYAAETGETTEMTGGRLALAAGDGVISPSMGNYTGCLFRVIGDHIKEVSLSIGEGGFYRQEVLHNLTQEKMAEFRQAQEQGTMAPTPINQANDGTWSAAALTNLGSSFSEAYNPEASYGFWMPDGTVPPSGSFDIREEAYQRIDAFDGATMTLTVTFADGSTQTRTLTLHTGRLKVVYEEDGTLTVLPELATGDEAFSYGIFAEEN